jgi:hypothetical protein
MLFTLIHRLNVNPVPYLSGQRIQLLFRLLPNWCRMQLRVSLVGFAQLIEQLLYVVCSLILFVFEELQTVESLVQVAGFLILKVRLLHIISHGLYKLLPFMIAIIWTAVSVGLQGLLRVQVMPVTEID